MFAYLIVTGVLLLHRQQSLAEINSDGFNIYKDFLRGKSEEPYSLYDGSDEPSYYLYRPSVITTPGSESGMEKRGVNQFKSLMLLPQREAELGGGEIMDKAEDYIYHFPRVVIKRAAPEDTSHCHWPQKYPLRK